MLVTKRTYLPVALCGLLTALGCSTDPSGPGDTLNDDVEFFDVLSYAEFEQSVQVSAVRIEAELVDSDEGLVAREVEIQSHDEVDDDEVIDGRIIDLDDAAGTITLNLGDLVVGFSGETQFRLPDNENAGREAFVARVAEVLGDGGTPLVRVKRPAPDAPQDPTDPTFDATVIELEHVEDAPRRLIVNVDRDNLVLNDAAPPPDGWLAVLGLMIELQVSNGVTEIEIERDDFEFVDFRGRVESVDLDARSFKLVEGPIVRLVNSTKIRFHEESDYHLRSLEEVSEALAAGRQVHAGGEGVLEETEPRTIVAAKVAFEVEAPPMQEFEGQVAELQLDARMIVLESGTVVQFTDETRIKPGWDKEHDHHLRTLAAVQYALDNGFEVFAAGKGVIESEEPLTLSALYVVFRIEGASIEDFEGVVQAVDLTARTVTINDIVIEVDDGVTHIHESDGGLYLVSLEEVDAALTNGETVFGFGYGIVTAEEPLAILALSVAFKPDREEGVAFEGQVTVANPEERTLGLADGTVVIINEHTKIHLANAALGYGTGGEDTPWIRIVSEALAAGVVVHASGRGEVVGEEPRTLVAIELALSFAELVEIEFDELVTSVNLEKGAFSLTDGLTIRITDATVIDANGDYAGLEAVAAALENETAVRATGRAEVVAGEDGFALRLNAVEVTFSTGS